MDLGITMSKLLPLLVYPFNVSLWLLMSATALLWFGRRRWAATLLGVNVALLLVCASPPLANALYARLERQYPPVAVADSPRADAIVVLGGGIGLPLPPRLEPDLNGSADRVWHAARLYRAGKAPLVIVSGGNVFPQSNAQAESVYTADLLEAWGVERKDIVLEGQSRNTYENALHTRTILEDRELRRILLVTSAFHMPRALATFEHAGIEAIASPTDFRVVGYEQPAVLGWIPSLGALGGTTQVLQEHLGQTVYRLRGWMR